MNAGAAISIVAPVSVSCPLTSAESGANSASAASASTEKAEATESCLDIVVSRFMVRCTNSLADLYCNAASTGRGKISTGCPAAVSARRARAYRKPMLLIVLSR